MAQPAVAAEKLDAAIAFSLEQTGCDELQLKIEQRKALSAVLNKKDTVVVLPTGYGKSLVYLLLPFAMRHIGRPKGTDTNVQPSVVVVIEPLSSLVDDQMKRATSMNLRTAKLPYHCTLYASEFKTLGEGNVSDCDKKLFDDICRGSFDILFSSPESMIYDTFWKKLLLEPRVRGFLTTIVVDEAHCILEWGGDFRPAYSELDSMTAQLPGASVLALTASATPFAIDEICKSLSMRHPVRITANPNRGNILYTVARKKTDLEEEFEWLIEELRSKREKTPRTLIYCTSVLECGLIYNIFANEIPDDEQYHPLGSDPSPQKRLFNQFHRPTPEEQKSIILKDLMLDRGVMRIVMATVALGLGVNCPDVVRTIHYGCPETLEQYYQESGRGGRSGQQSTSTLLYNGRDIREDRVKPEMRKYCLEEKCLRYVIVNHFGFCVAHAVNPKHNCCSVCAKTCTCQHCSE